MVVSVYLDLVLSEAGDDQKKRAQCGEARPTEALGLLQFCITHTRCITLHLNYI